MLPTSVLKVYFTPFRHICQTFLLRFRRECVSEPQGA